MRTRLVCLLLASVLSSGCRCIDQPARSDDAGGIGPTYYQFWELRRDFERYGRGDHWYMASDPWDEW
ncbi:MAG: hypothetical protein JSW27_09425 [Phycisphaerales bacterium]|nr:MAG: hypothetical protein JSW27_09425 [Phycisphaerales bacterium]